MAKKEVIKKKKNVYQEAFLVNLQSANARGEIITTTKMMAKNGKDIVRKGCTRNDHVSTVEDEQENSEAGVNYHNHFLNKEFDWVSVL